MSQRYKYINIKKDPDTKRKMFVTTLYPKIPTSDSDIYIITKEGDRLDNLAYLYYGDVSLYWIIAQANHVGKGTYWLTPGQQFRIPVDTTSIVRLYHELNVNR
jgi:nucleoid-associated protein YgaU